MSSLSGRCRASRYRRPHSSGDCRHLTPPLDRPERMARDNPRRERVALGLPYLRR
jgi:hypothetical protein